MSECVVRMEMPESCKKCKITICLWVKDDDLDYMDVIEKVQDFRKKNNDVGFPDFCPIICQLPEGHGRLVDADACAGVLRKLEKEAVKPTEKLCFGYAAKMFEEAFTIVPAEWSNPVRSEGCGWVD